MSLAQIKTTDGIDALAAARLGRLLNPAPTFAAQLFGAADRAAVERYIAARFEAVHGAHIHDFMPVLLTMNCCGVTTAAAGIRTAAGQALFLEQYLSAPIEQATADLCGRQVPRSRIAEIGNLVATQGGSSYLLFMILTAILEQAGFEQVVFTATPQVRKALQHLGLRVETLCLADPARLTTSSIKDWGRYYATQPQVVAGELKAAMSTLRSRRVFAGVLCLFQSSIEALGQIVAAEACHRGTTSLAA